MNLVILASADLVARRAAAMFSEAVHSDPSLVVALPTGRTPLSMYQILAAMRDSGEFDLSAGTVFNLDEVLLPRSQPLAFFQYMTRHVWDPLGIAPGRRFIPDGETKDPDAECLRYEAAILGEGGIDMAILGIGVDGHIAYNLPGQSAPRTHLVDLDVATVTSLGSQRREPMRAITMGVQTILSSRRILLLATGRDKAQALRRMRDEPVGDRWPCTYLRDHPFLTVLADEPAGSQL